jgi:hypothetical protein
MGSLIISGIDPIFFALFGTFRQLGVGTAQLDPAPAVNCGFRPAIRTFAIIGLAVGFVTFLAPVPFTFLHAVLLGMIALIVAGKSNLCEKTGFGTIE